MIKRTFTCAALSDDDNGVSILETLGGAGDFAITGALASGGVATMGAGQPITLTSVGDDSGIEFIVSGTDADGTVISEDITGGNAGAVTTTAFFKTVTQITASGATAADVKIGPLKANDGVSPSLEVDSGQWGADWFPTIFTHIGSGTYDVEYTAREKNDTYINGWSNDTGWTAITAFSAKTVNIASIVNLAYHGLRLKITTHTSGDFVGILIVPKPHA